MKLLVYALLGLPFSATAFIPAVPSLLTRPYSNESPRNSLSASGEKEPVINQSPTEAGTHEELLYALGVNLARQLGDVRPLVENGEELTFVAKGLLDAVIGRLSEEGQIALLKERQEDLNTLITERA